MLKLAGIAFAAMLLVGGSAFASDAEPAPDSANDTVIACCGGGGWGGGGWGGGRRGGGWGGGGGWNGGGCWNGGCYYGG